MTGSSARQELSTEERDVAPGVASRSGLLSWLACAIVFATFTIADALVWEPAHDEGVTWTQAFGAVDVARCPATTSVESLRPTLDGAGRHSPRDVVAALVRDGMHPPAYYLLLNGWASWLGTGRLALCVPAIVLGVFSLLAMGRIASSLAPGRASGAWAMLLLASSPWFIGYSVFARPYALVLFASLWSTWALLEIHVADRLAESNGRRRLGWRAIFVAASCLGLYSLYHYAFVLVWQAAATWLLAWQSGRSRRSEVLASLAMALAIVCGYAPWFANLSHHLGVAGASSYYFAGWVPLAEWPEKWGHLLLVFGLGEGLWSTSAQELRVAATVIGLCTLPLALQSLLPSRLQRLVPAARVLWITAPLLPFSILASDWIRETHTIFVSKTTFIFLPILILLALRGWQGLSKPWMARAGLSACVLLCATATLAAIQTRGRVLTSFEVMAEYLRRTDAGSHRVVLSSDRRGYTIPFLLTLRSAGVRAARVTLAPSQELGACVDSLLVDPRSERVTLVDFEVPYDRRGSWRKGDLQRAAKRARSLGWRELALPAGDEQVALRARRDRFWRGQFTELAGNPRVLVIASPTKTKYFSE